jgi:tetratricopeptide (TPR) repeat protein
MSDLPLLAFRQAICLGVDARAVDTLFARDPRFAELAIFRGLIASAQRDLDAADARYREAYAWRATWPAATLLIANVAMTGEEFPAALEFYEKTLVLAPSFPDALLGKLRALSYLARHGRAGRRRRAPRAQALSRRRITGAPRTSWRWTASTRPGKTSRRPTRQWSTAMCPSWRASSHCEGSSRTRRGRSSRRLASAIPTIAKRVLPPAGARRSAALVRSPRSPSSTAGCLDDAEAAARQDIERIAASRSSEARKARQIARRRQQIASAVRMRATCWFNAAVANFNLSKPDEARRYAEKVADDEQFGERARDLTARITK